MRPLTFACLFLLVAAAGAGCSRPEGGGRFELAGPSLVSLELSQPGMETPLCVLAREAMTAGPHKLELRAGRLFVDGSARGDRLPAGEWQWRAFAHEAFQRVERGRAIGTFGPGEASDAGWPAAGGVPCAVAAQGQWVFLGSGAGLGSGSLVALDLAGRCRWSHQRAGFGVHALGADAGAVFVLAHESRKEGQAAAGGSILYKLDAATGRPMAWENEAGAESLAIASLWPPAGADADPKSRPRAADAMAVGNGRIYLSFSEAGFVAVLDARDGHYVTTLSGPSPGQMALSTTPMRDAQGKEQVADFGVVVLAQSALSYFVMPHDPPWVAFNTTRWLGQGELLTAFAMKAETMKSGDVDLFVALAPPRAQIQRRVVGDPTGFTLALGKPGGRRQPAGPWDPLAFGEVRSMAFASDGNLWVAEGESCPPRFCVWSIQGDAAELQREFFPPASGAEMQGAAVFPSDPGVLVAAGCEWQIGSPAGGARCVGVIAPGGMQEASFLSHRERALLVVRDDAPSLSFYERQSPGVWRLLAQLEARPGKPPVYWADANGDGRRQRAELHPLKAALPEFPSRALPGGTLAGGAAHYGIGGWTDCGAPLIDWEKPAPAPEAPGPQRAMLESALSEAERPSLLQTPEGRAFFLSREGNAPAVVELVAAQRSLGAGTWKIGAE